MIVELPSRLSTALTGRGATAGTMPIAPRLKRRRGMKKIVIVFLELLTAIGCFSPSHGLLLCAYWGGFNGDWVQSPNDGWSHTYYWNGDAVAAPGDGLYQVTIETMAGDNDDDWHHSQQSTQYVWLPSNYRVVIEGKVKQAWSNYCGSYIVSGSLKMLNTNGIEKLRSGELTYYAGGPPDSPPCGRYYCQTDSNDNCYVTDPCCGSNADEDIDRARSKITVRAVRDTGQARLWSEATARAAM